MDRRKVGLAGDALFAQRGEYGVAPQLVRHPGKFHDVGEPRTRGKFRIAGQNQVVDCAEPRFVLCSHARASSE